jgi:hypothetical protein
VTLLVKTFVVDFANLSKHHSTLNPKIVDKSSDILLLIVGSFSVYTLGPNQNARLHLGNLEQQDTWRLWRTTQYFDLEAVM